jgi:hypothetical protein
LFSDEAWVSLRKVNSHNKRYWSAENPRSIQRPFHEGKVAIWCARRIIGRVLYAISVQITEEEKLSGVLRQDSAAANTAYASLEELPKVSCDSVFGRRLWPPPLPDLTPCGF